MQTHKLEVEVIGFENCGEDELQALLLESGQCPYEKGFEWQYAEKEKGFLLRKRARKPFSKADDLIDVKVLRKFPKAVGFRFDRSFRAESFEGKLISLSSDIKTAAKNFASSRANRHLVLGGEPHLVSRSGCRLLSLRDESG